MRPAIWFITFDGLPELDPDDGLAAEILRRRGFICAPKVWDDPTVDWSQCQFAVMRSTWDYHMKYAAFESWLSQPVFKGRMWNPPELMLWNTRKTYLRELEKSGVEIVPTVWLDRGIERETVANLLAQMQWRDVVLKPIIGLATSGISKLDLRDHCASVEKVMELLATHDVMLQPYMSAVETEGERSLIFIDGKFSHAVRKTAFQQMAPTGEAGERSIKPEADEVSMAEQAVKVLRRPVLYARVDVIRDPVQGKPKLMELELMEPSLFLGFHGEAPTRFADAIERIAG